MPQEFRASIIVPLSEANPATDAAALLEAWGNFTEHTKTEAQHEFAIVQTKGKIKAAPAAPKQGRKKTIEKTERTAIDELLAPVS